MQFLIILAIFLAVYYVVGLAVILFKVGPNETGAGGYFCGIFLWAFIWPIVLFLGE